MSRTGNSGSGNPVVFTTADEELHRCVIAGDVDACRRVLEAEQATVDVNRVKPVRGVLLRSFCGPTALRGLPVCYCLLQYTGNTPLEEAMMHRHAPIVRLLLERGADARIGGVRVRSSPIPFQFDSSQASVLMSAHSDLSRSLSQPYYAFNLACGDPNPEFFQLFIQHGLDPNAAFDVGLASSCASDLHSRTDNAPLPCQQHGATPAHMAAASGNIKVLELLSEAKVDFNKLDDVRNSMHRRNTCFNLDFGCYVFVCRANVLR